MSLNVHGLANSILHVLVQQKPEFEYLEGRQLIKELKMYTGDRYEAHQIMDSIEFLERKGDVETFCRPSYDRISWRWEKVTITPKGMDKINTNPEEYLPDKKYTGNISQNVTIYGPNTGSINQAGIGNIELKWERVETEIEIEPNLTSDQKNILLKNARIIKEEGKKETKNISRLKEAAEKIGELSKSPLRDLILGVGGNALYDLLIQLLSS